MSDLFSYLPHPGGTPLDALAVITLLAVLPIAVILLTPFIRIVIALSLLRQALGTQNLPPNIAITGIALVLTLVVMKPTLAEVNHSAIVPYRAGHLDRAEIGDRLVEPFRHFMLRQTRRSDVELFARFEDVVLARPLDGPLPVVVPAFLVGELRAGFVIGLVLYLPFVAIDFAVASILMGLGMTMLSPPVISTPCKILLFVAIDGWALICDGVMHTIR